MTLEKVGLLLVITLALLAVTNSQLRPTNKHMNDVAGLTTSEAIMTLTLEQPEVYRKALKHHLLKVESDLKNLGYPREKINTKIYEKFTAGNGHQDLFKELEDYMIETIFNKFGNY